MIENSCKIKKKRKKNSVAHHALGAPQKSEIRIFLNWPAPHLLPSSLLYISPPLPLSLSTLSHFLLLLLSLLLSSSHLLLLLLLLHPPSISGDLFRWPTPAGISDDLRQPPATMTSSSGHGDLLLRRHGDLLLLLLLHHIVFR